ncbi:uncharacterized protein M421DRAFT_385506 [Didymella exigua CBS 183.55]|uniref:Uncharacterized protein n=1 Tax=Didymella exigua CBS 183.55 TaxID=1150837 RepID=A0A6A5RS15_9PLEO|nr:uncharacterized protein M421DRAFT_385506 [Didymella exigua CBS 183.55]KAF1930140.1 hypothetical protein M421DRAFT_385506 [Didymella exigua CBS 183.55]
MSLDDVSTSNSIGRKQHTVVGVLSVTGVSGCCFGLRLGIWIGGGGGSDRSRKGEKSERVLHLEECECRNEDNNDPRLLFEIEPLSCCGVMASSAKRAELHILIPWSYIEASVTQLNLANVVLDSQTDQRCYPSQTQCCSLTKSSSCSTNAGFIDCGMFSARMACACHHDVKVLPDGGGVAVGLPCIQTHIAMSCTGRW